MTAVPDNTMGGQIKAALMKPEHAQALAAALFDGKRELKVAGRVVVTPNFAKMTAHEQLILKGLFLKAEVMTA